MSILTSINSPIAPTAAHYSIWLTEPKAIALAGINCGLLFLILLYFIVSKVVTKAPKVKAKAPKWVLWLFRPGWATWLAFILAFIVGLIYYSLSKEYHLIWNPANTADPFGGKLWVWQSIQFMYSIGSWIVIFILFSLWLSSPFIALISFSNMYKEQQNTQYHMKRLLWILIVLGITLGAANIMWAFPINSQYTSLSMFGLNALTAPHQDYFYHSMKVVYEYVILTKWYAWVFLSYCAICILVAWSLVHVAYTKRIHGWFSRYWIYKDTSEAYQNTFKTRFNQVKFWFTLPFEVSNSLSSLEFYAFWIAFSLFNIRSLWLHITFILIVCLIAYAAIVLVSLVYGMFKYRKEGRAYWKAVGGITWDIIKPFFFLKHDKNYDSSRIESERIRAVYDNNSKLASAKLSENIVVPVAFTVFLGICNLPTFPQGVYQVGTYTYGPIMHGANYWLTLIISGFLFSYMYVGVGGSTSHGKNIVGASTYAITPGMQTGVLGTLSSTLTHFAKWTDNCVKLVF
ncbi:hypothetical protein [Ureaplasma ceti]|uniref:ABC transporter permease n=1 Tax=Ureaplasma ceti TaxID=3119530 RepID=A0ABP9UBG2_9BACT